MAKAKFLCYTYTIMEIRQKLQLKNLLIPELNQSLKILALSSLDLKTHIENELLNNPFLEDAPLPLHFLRLKRSKLTKVRPSGLILILV